MKPTTRILHVDLDAFFVAVEQAREPSLRGRPVVVGALPGSRGVVAAASYEARAYGLHSGMPLAQAQRLCPQAVYLPGSFGRYRQASEGFHAILASFTPEVEPLGLDEAYLNLTGFEPLYGPPQDTARRIKERVRRELGLVASVGIAGSKVVAKVASDLSKPDGLLEVPPGQERAFLAPLPVRKLPCVGAKTEPILRSLEVETIGDLAALALELLQRSFGRFGELLHLHAQGLDPRGVEPIPPPKSISRSTTFLADTLDRSLLHATLCYFSERVAAALRAEGKQARCITLTLRYADFYTISRSRTLPHPTLSDQVIYHTGLALLDEALGQHYDKVRLIGIGVSQLVQAGIQLHLLDPSVARRARLYGVLDSLRRKYGFTSLLSGLTLPLGDLYEREPGGYVLKTPSLSR